MRILEQEKKQSILYYFRIVLIISSSSLMKGAALFIALIQKPSHFAQQKEKSRCKPRACTMCFPLLQYRNDTIILNDESAPNNTKSSAAYWQHFFLSTYFLSSSLLALYSLEFALLCHS